ncbi:hypothetical protein [Nostoc sp. FACHB-888]|uniref:hypothetical protein n=1 Tax=Nostoc sp. FACHB-888 TaxID=2692842 RepID=UPI00168913C7|nr:hypothetical protein [Nostoc sp. FACHB-888]MBD2248403.1 hypothetical protein [Nostoc sp. FACHB-888]
MKAREQLRKSRLISTVLVYRPEAQEISTIFGYWSFQQEKAFEPKSTYSTKPKTEDSSITKADFAGLKLAIASKVNANYCCRFI